MLTARENFNEIRKPDGKPERFVKQYEPFAVTLCPVNLNAGHAMPGQIDVVDNWGVTSSWPEGQPGGFPNHRQDLIVCPDIEDWKSTVKAPSLIYPEAEWEACLEQCEKVDRKSQYLTAFMAPGIFEQTHMLMEITNALMAFYENPDEMHELIKYITEWELEACDIICDHLHPDAMMHHDDWGTQISTFISPDMFEEFFLEPYKLLYGHWKERGVELIIHHSDSYAETLVPYMIEMGIDVWQGCMETNDIKRCIKEYGDKITFMGGIDSATVDYPGWTEEVIRERVREVCDKYGPMHFIPSQSQGLAISTFPGVYECIDAMIDEYSPIYFKEHGLA